MLSAEHSRYVSMCIDKISSGETNKELARRYGVSESTVKNAVAWGRDNGVFDTDITVKLEKHIQAFRKRLAMLDEYLKSEFERNEKIRVSTDGFEALPSKQLIMIFQEIREHQTKVMELEGIYRQYVNVNQTNNNQQNVFIIPQAAESQEDWQELVKRYMASSGHTVQIPSFDEEEASSLGRDAIEGDGE